MLTLPLFEVCSFGFKRSTLKVGTLRHSWAMLRISLQLDPVTRDAHFSHDNPLGTLFVFLSARPTTEIIRNDETPKNLVFLRTDEIT